MEKICFLFGHRDTPDSIQPAIEAAVESLFTVHNVRHYIVGSYGNFDRMAAIALGKIKAKHPELYLELLTPYHPSERPVTLPPGFDAALYPAGLESAPRRLAIVRANGAALRMACAAICYVQYPGNTQKLLQTAEKRREKENFLIYNLAAPEV